MEYFAIACHAAAVVARGEQNAFLARLVSAFPADAAQTEKKFVSAPARSLTDIRLDHQIIGGEFAPTYRLAKTRQLSPRRTRRPQDRPSPTPRPSPPPAQVDVSGVKTSGPSLARLGAAPSIIPRRPANPDNYSAKFKHPTLAAKPAETDKSIRPSYRRSGDSQPEHPLYFSQSRPNRLRRLVRPRIGRALREPRRP